jgi:hypothetical protein
MHWKKIDNNLCPIYLLGGTVYKNLVLFTLTLLISCASQVRDVKYKTYELVGIEKRDLFKKEINNVKDEQEDSKEAFSDALEKLQHFYSFDVGKIEKEYKKLKSSYEKSQDEAIDLSESITKLDTVAQDLFKEWKNEIGTMENASFKKDSSQKLKETRNKYASLHQKLKNSEKKMKPILSKLKDQVTYLKHNLNASAIAGLKTEGDRIETDMSKLIQEMKEASREADEFISTL